MYKELLENNRILAERLGRYHVNSPIVVLTRKSFRGFKLQFLFLKFHLTTLRLVVLIAPPKNGLKWFEILHKDILGWQEPLCHLYLSSTCLRRSDFWHNSHSRPHYDLIDGQIGLRRNYIMSFDVGKLPWKFGTPKLSLSRGPMPSKFGFLKKFSLKTSLWPHRWPDWPA